MAAAARHVVTTSASRDSGPMTRCSGARIAGTAAAAINAIQTRVYPVGYLVSDSAPTSASITTRTASPSIRGRGSTIGLSGSSAAVNRGDLVPILLQHHTAFDLQGGGQLAGRLGEVTRENPE